MAASFLVAVNTTRGSHWYHNSRRAGGQSAAIENAVAARFTHSSTIVRDQTVAAVSIGADDMGVIDRRGDNQLSVVSGFAREDVRLSNITGSVVKAAGMTLNGNSYSGPVQGPASVPPDYRIVDARGVIQFRAPRRAATPTAG